MDKIFNPDNPVMRFLTWFCNMMYINVLFMITSIPIVTIGASWSAMYTVCIKLIRKEETYIARDYFNAFKDNFKQATTLWIPSLILSLIWFGNLYIIFNQFPDNMKLFQVPIWLLLFATFSIIIYAFPLMALYETNTKQLIKNSFLIALSSLPTTLMILVLHLIPIFYAAFSGVNLIRVFSILIFFGFALIAYLSSFFLNHVLEKYEQDESTSENV